MSRQQLEERLQDAACALMMYRLMEAEGSRMRRRMELLEQDPAFAVPEELDRRCMALIHRHFARQRAAAAGKLALRAARYISVAITVMALLFTTAFAAFEQVRLGTLNLLMEVADYKTKLTMVSGTPEREEEEVVTLRRYRLPAVPEGFRLETMEESPFESFVLYAEGDHRSVSVLVTDGDCEAYLDTEDAEVENLVIHGYPGLFVKKSIAVTETEQTERLIAFWGDTDHDLFVQITTVGVEEELFWSMVDQTIYAE